MTDNCRSAGKSLDDLGRLLRLKVREDQGDRLRMLVHDEGQQVLVVDLLQEAEGQGLDRLADVVQRDARALAQRLFDQLLGDLQAARPNGHARRIGPGELLDVDSCSSPVTEPSLAISIETASTCLGSSLLINCAASSSGRLISRTAALRRSYGMAGR